MKMIEIIPAENIDIDEYRRSICFVSEDILSINEKDGKIVIGIADEGDELQIRQELLAIMKKYRQDTSINEYFFKSKNESTFYYDIFKDCGLIDFGNGQIGFDEKGKFIMEYFDSVFCGFAKRYGAMEKVYPVMLPIGPYSLTGYLKKSPQYSFFCSSIKDNLSALEETDESVKNSEVREIIKEPEFALSPSACFHTYIEYKNKELEKNTLVTFTQNVFRNEGRLNYFQKGRLCDYHVREIVMIGSQEYCVSVRDKIMDDTVNLLVELNLRGDISLASDSFVIPKMQMYRRLQHIDKSKYEMHLYTGINEKVSTASFNLHGKAFTDPFNICVRGEDTVTACIGFGLQRFVISFFSQFGYNEDHWPERIKLAYLEYQGKK
ncbi:MAG: hypothetical protein J5517_06540 [Eubacterium sp.]|nr:hypothetical protein [Eubacterium sp.]